MKQIIKSLLPKLFLNTILNVYNTIYNPKPQVHLRNIFGFDLYQNHQDIINYKRFTDMSLQNLTNHPDSRIFHSINRYTDESSVAIDVGANIGLMTLAMSEIVGPSGKLSCLLNLVQ